MRTLFCAVGAALLIAVATMLFGQNEPAHWLLASVGPGRTLDVFVVDRYFVFAPTLFLVNVIVFSIVLYLLGRNLLRVSRRRQGGAGA